MACPPLRHRTAGFSSGPPANERGPRAARDAATPRSLEKGSPCGLARGKAGPDALDGSRQGINDYTGWFASDKDMSGDYFGYDGCCPPWNDEIPHHYVFTLYALDVEKLAVSGTFTGQDVWKAIEGHVLDKAAITGVYSLNPDVAAKL